MLALFSSLWTDQVCKSDFHPMPFHPIEAESSSSVMLVARKAPFVSIATNVAVALAIVPFSISSRSPPLRSLIPPHIHIYPSSIHTICHSYFPARNSPLISLHLPPITTLSKYPSRKLFVSFGVCRPLLRPSASTFSTSPVWRLLRLPGA